MEWIPVSNSFRKKIKSDTPRRHMTSWRCIDVDTTLHKRLVPASKTYELFAAYRIIYIRTISRVVRKPVIGVSDQRRSRWICVCVCVCGMTGSVTFLQWTWYGLQKPHEGSSVSDKTERSKPSMLHMLSIWVYCDTFHIWFKQPFVPLEFHIPKMTLNGVYFKFYSFQTVKSSIQK